MNWICYVFVPVSLTLSLYTSALTNLWLYHQKSKISIHKYSMMSRPLIHQVRPQVESVRRYKSRWAPILPDRSGWAVQTEHGLPGRPVCEGLPGSQSGHTVHRGLTAPPHDDVTLWRVQGQGGSPEDDHEQGVVWITISSCHLWWFWIRKDLCDGNDCQTGGSEIIFDFIFVSLKGLV